MILRGFAFSCLILLVSCASIPIEVVEPAPITQPYLVFDTFLIGALRNCDMLPDRAARKSCLTSIRQQAKQNIHAKYPQASKKLMLEYVRLYGEEDLGFYRHYFRRLAYDGSDSVRPAQDVLDKWAELYFYENVARVSQRIADEEPETKLSLERISQKMNNLDFEPEMATIKQQLQRFQN